MPTILWVQGWRLFFYRNEGSEPMHIHARKADAECKYWIHGDLYETEEDWSYQPKACHKITVPHIGVMGVKYPLYGG